MHPAIVKITANGRETAAERLKGHVPVFPYDVGVNDTTSMSAVKLRAADLKGSRQPPPAAAAAEARAASVANFLLRSEAEEARRDSGESINGNPALGPSSPCYCTPGSDEHRPRVLNRGPGAAPGDVTSKNG